VTILPSTVYAYPIPDLDAQGAILLEQNSGKILYAKNENQRFYPASTTKILTALIVLENCELDEIVTVGEEIKLIQKDGSSADLEVGEKLTVKDLLNGLMLPSGNDAANVLAVYVARKLTQDATMEVAEALQYFAALMNERAEKAGATDSHFTNPHGLHDENHYTTPVDLAKIALAAMANPTFREIVRTEEYQADVGVSADNLNTGKLKVWENTNKLLDKDSKYYLKEATGIKTGFTTPAGYCLVSSASANGLDLIGVVLNTTAPGRWNDSIKLLKFGLEEFQYVQLLKAGTEVAKVTIANPGRKDSGELSVLATTDFVDLLHISQVSAVEKQIRWNEKVRVDNSNMLKAPIKEGQELGQLFLTLDGFVLTESTLVAARTVKSDNLLENIFSGNFPYHWFFGGWLIFLFITINLSGRRKRRKNIKF